MPGTSCLVPPAIVYLGAPAVGVAGNALSGLKDTFSRKSAVYGLNGHSANL